MDKVKQTTTATILCLLLLFLAGCGTVKESSASSETNLVQRRNRQDSPLNAIAQPLAGHTDLSLRMAVEATYGDKTLPVKGNLRMRRGEVIQMAFTALGMIEVARIEMTPEAVWIIDRMGKQYAKVRYAELPYISNVLVNFDLVQSLLWNELFIPGQKNVAASLDKFTIEPSGTSQLIAPRDQKALACRFWADGNLTRLQRTRLQLGSAFSDWTYAGYLLVGDTRYPSSVSATVQTDSKQAAAKLTFSNIALDNKEWQTRTNLANYPQITAAELLSKLSFLK